MYNGIQHRHGGLYAIFRVHSSDSFDELLDKINNVDLLTSSAQHHRRRSEASCGSFLVDAEPL